MKKINIISALSLVILLLSGLTTQLIASNETDKTIVEKTFSVAPNVQLSVDHEFGSLDCKNWERDEISVTIIARINSDNQEKIEKALDRIEYVLSGSANSVNVSCTIKNKGNKGRTNLSVDIFIKMPKSVRLDIKHKFGQAFIDQADGVSKLMSEYGAMTVNALNAPESKLKIAFGEGNIGHFEGGYIGVSYSKLSLGSTDKTIINSDYSDISVDKADQLSITHEGGDMKIGYVNMIDGKSSFGSMTIDGLNNSLQIDSDYGSLVVRNIEKGFTEIVVANDYGSAKLFIDDNATYSIDATSSYGSIEYPESLANLTYREKTTSKTVYKGIIGKEKQANSTVKLTSDYGSIELIAN